MLSDVEYAIQLLAKKLKKTCVILCVDEVNKVYRASSSQFQSLVNCVGKLSCSKSPFVIPILGGTVIIAMEEIIRDSTHPPLRIPLPLLSYDSSLQIMRKKLEPDPETYKNVSSFLGQFVADIGGHPRALEILYDKVLSFSHFASHKDYVEYVFSVVQREIKERYALDILQIDDIIAKVFLSQTVTSNDIVRYNNKLTFQHFQEMGLLKLRPLLDKTRITRPHSVLGKEIKENPDCHVFIPYVFLSGVLVYAGGGSIRKFWRQFLLDRKFQWNEWELFNRNYLAFRLFLHSYLGEEKTLSLRSFFNGAQFNLVSGTKFIVPPVKSIQTSDAGCRFPKSQDVFKSYTFVLNAAGAPFHAFVYFDTAEENKRLLVAFQMKFSDAKKHEKVTNKLISTEFKRVEEAIDESLPGTEFVLIFPINREKVKGFSGSDLPSNCIVIANEERRAFYGELYYHQLDPFD